MKKVIISLLILTLLMASALSSCEWLNTEEPHECESLCAECGDCLNGECEDSACAEKCEGHIPPHKCEHLCEECGGCLDAECKEDSCTEKCSCHNKDTLCPECGGCIDTDFCTYEGCNVKCSCPRYVNVEKEIVDVLLEHIYTVDSQYSITPWTTEKKISKVKDGSMQPLLVTFDSVNTYYIGVYSSGEHEIPDYFYFLGECFCVDDYVWVRFDKFEDIKRTYNNRDILAIFAIREVSSVSDIRSSDADVPEFVVYEMLYRNISKDDEIHPKKLSAESFVYLVESNEDTVYYTSDSFLEYLLYMNCILFNDEYYLIYPTFDLEYFQCEFGEYYDELIAIADTESYSKINSSGKEVFYTIIKVGDFAEVIKGEKR